MFLIRMIVRSLSRQLRKRLLIALTMCLSACVCVAMLSVVYDVGDKLNAELSSYGSNIVVQPKASAVISDLYGTRNEEPQDVADTFSHQLDTHSKRSNTLLQESDAVKIKTIFWAFNITNFSPTLNTRATLKHRGNSHTQSKPVRIIGTWFHRKLKLASGESSVVGMRGMRSWWKLEGRWARDGRHEAMVGSKLAQQRDIHLGDTLILQRVQRQVRVHVVGIMHSGDRDDNAIYTDSLYAQTLANVQRLVERIEVKALTTPENDLARKAAKNPAALSQDEWETWYCTAYPSSITYQIEEVIPGAVAKQVRQVAALQGNILNKTRALMIVMTGLSLLAAALAVANLMAACMSERAGELALLKALGARNAAVVRLMLCETAVIAFIGAMVGMAAGFGVAQIIGYSVFGSAIAWRPMVFVLGFVLLALTVLIAAGSSIRSILRVRPAEVLHGR